jgi:hypothetical protein
MDTHDPWQERTIIPVRAGIRCALERIVNRALASPAGSSQIDCYIQSLAEHAADDRRSASEIVDHLVWRMRLQHF